MRQLAVQSSLSLAGNHSTLEVAFPGRPKAEKTDWSGGSRGRQGGSRAEPKPRSAPSPADVTVREFKSPKLGGNPARFYS